MNFSFNNSLLFKNNTTQNAAKLSECAADDLDMCVIINFLCKLNRDFPAYLLLKPLNNVSDAEYRIAVLNEIFQSQKIHHTLSSITLKLKKINNAVDDFKNEQNNDQKKLIFINCMVLYHKTIAELCEATSSACANGLARLHKLCKEIIDDNAFITTGNIAKSLLSRLVFLQNNFGMTIDDKRITTYLSEADDTDTARLISLIQDVYGIKVSFESNIYKDGELDCFEQQIFEIMKNENISLFNEIDAFYSENSDYLIDFEEITTLYPQLCFFLTLADMYKIMTENGVNVCTPVFDSNVFKVADCTSPALFAVLYSNGRLTDIIPNDIEINRNNAVIVTGPNQGGKTVYLKCIGQNAQLARCGCLVNAKSCRVPLYDAIETHFLKPETEGLGRLAEEVLRIEDISKKLTENTLILFNESFTTTYRSDGLRLAIYYIKKVLDKGASAVFVTHFSELYDSINCPEKTVALYAETNENGKRSYRIVCGSGDHSARAHDIVSECGMTYDQIITNLKEERK